MANLDFAKALYDRPHGWGSFVSALSDALETTPSEAYITPLALSRRVSTDVLLSQLGRGDRSVQVLRAGKGVTLCALRYKSASRQSSRRIEGKFFLVQPPQAAGVLLAISLEGNEFWKSAFFPSLRLNYPLVVLPFLPHDRFRDMLLQFKRANGFSKIEITRASYRFRTTGEQDEARRSVPAVSWPKWDLEKAFDWIHEQDGWFKSLHLKALRHSREVCDFTLTRTGFLKTNAQIASILDAFIHPICSALRDRLNLFANRERAASPQLSTHPITVRFSSFRFRDGKSNPRFIAALRELPQASVSVVHANPYIQASVLDYFDGSSADIWVLDDRSMHIAPRHHTTPAFLHRLVSHVFDHFAEGDVLDFSEACA